MPIILPIRVKLYYVSVTFFNQKDFRQALIVNVLSSNDKTIRVNKKLTATSEVQAVFSELTSLHIEYALDSLDKRVPTIGIRDRKAYLRILLFKAPTEMNPDYQPDDRLKAYWESGY